jgi:hypothetical protein
LPLHSFSLAPAARLLATRTPNRPRPVVSPSSPPKAIEAPALAVMVPLLIRGLREGTPIQRKACVITTNMAKLVNSPLDAAHFLPVLVPGGREG